MGPCRHKDKSTAPTSDGDFAQAPASRPRQRRAQLRARKDAFFPKHVQACVNNDLPGPVWSIAVWRKSAPGEQTRVPYSCNSYRCTSEACQKHAAHVDFARIKEALDRPLPLTQGQICRVAKALRGKAKEERRSGLEAAKADEQARGWVFIVATLDRNGRFSGSRPWANEQEAFRDLQKLSQGLLRDLRAMQEARGWRVTENEWVAVVESHVAGWPHVNFLVYSPELSEELRRDEETLANLGVDARGRRLVRGELARVLTREHSMGRKEWVRTVDRETGEVIDTARTVRAGWGIQSTAEAARNREALAGYVVKLGAAQDRTVGEVAKLTQVPSNARMKLRRLRAGVAFLPKRRKNQDWTGAMVKRRRTREGDWDVDLAVDPALVKVVLTEEDRANLAGPLRSLGVAGRDFAAQLATREAAEVEKRRALYMEGALLAVRHELVLYLEEEREAATTARGERGALQVRNRRFPLKYSAHGAGFKRESAADREEAREPFGSGE